MNNYCPPRSVNFVNPLSVFVEILSQRSSRSSYFPCQFFCSSSWEEHLWVEHCADEVMLLRGPSDSGPRAPLPLARSRDGRAVMRTKTAILFHSDVFVVFTFASSLSAAAPTYRQKCIKMMWKDWGAQRGGVSDTHVTAVHFLATHKHISITLINVSTDEFIYTAYLQAYRNR